MHPRIERLLHGLGSPLRPLRRILRRVTGRSADGGEGADKGIAARHAKSENDMTEHNELDAKPQDDADFIEDAAGAGPGGEGASVSDEDLEATLRSMQGELADLTDILTSDSAGAEGAAPIEPPVAEAAGFDDLTEDAGIDPSAAGVFGGAENAEAESTLSDALASIGDADEDAAVDDSTLADALGAAGEFEPETAAPVSDAFEAPTPAVEPEPVAANFQADASQDVAPQMDEQFEPEAPQAYTPPPRASAPAAGFATARRRAFEESSVPEPPPRAARPVQRSSAPPTSAVESAIRHFASFLEGEVNGLWEDARNALTDIVEYRDRMAQATERIENLEREMLTMRDEIAFSRREARNLQAQMQNIRDDASRARQRADAAAMDAQSAADRAISATREIETAASLHRDR